jgi:hypothetical protein
MNLIQNIVNHAIPEAASISAQLTISEERECTKWTK